MATLSRGWRRHRAQSTMIWAMPRPANRVFHVSYRVQFAGVVSLLAVPVILAGLVWLLVDLSPWLAVAVGAAFVIGLQAAVAKRWTGRRPTTVSPSDAPRIHAIVERLCVAGNLAKPKIVLHDERYANSWTRGLTSGRTTLHLTSRLVEMLDEHQLEAVIAHELSHVGQRDSALMSAIGTPVAALLDGALLYFQTPSSVIGGMRDAKLPVPNTPEANASFRLIKLEGSAIGAFFWLLLLPVGLLFLLVGGVSRAITALFSRARELEADAGAARLTGNPAALASALIALSPPQPGTTPTVDLRRAASLDVFHIVAVGEEHPFSRTHPPLKRRLKQLSEIETKLQRHGPG